MTSHIDWVLRIPTFQQLDQTFHYRICVGTTKHYESVLILIMLMNITHPQKLFVRRRQVVILHTRQMNESFLVIPQTRPCLPKKIQDFHIQRHFLSPRFPYYLQLQEITQYLVARIDSNDQIIHFLRFYFKVSEIFKWDKTKIFDTPIPSLYQKCNQQKNLPTVLHPTPQTFPDSHLHSSTPPTPPTAGATRIPSTVEDPMNCSAIPTP